MRKLLVRTGVAAAAVAAVLVARATLFAPAPVPVLVEEVTTGPVEATVTNSRAGTVRARHRAKLSPEIGGKVVSLPHREGERVEQGDVVLRLEDSAQRARLELALQDQRAAAAERDRACLAAERASRELLRTRKLAEDHIVSTDLLDEVESARLIAEAACAAAAANVDRARAAVTVARTELAKTVLRAPFDGIVAEVSIEEGEWTTPSPPGLPIPPVIDILDPSSVYISAPMDEVDSGRIAPGMPARVTVDSYRDQVFTGVVSRIAPYVLDIEQQNRTVEIEVELDDKAPATLLPGTSADVEVILQVRQEALRVPTQALLEGDRVLLLEDERLVERQVTTGLRNWDFTEIVDGLAPGSRVVVSLDRPEVRAGALAVAVDRLPED